jgi:hypothetical protein
MSDAPRAQATRSSAPPAEGAGPARGASAGGSAAPAGATAEFEFSEEHKEALAALAASASFVGVCVMLLGFMSATFAAAALYASFAAVGGGLFAGACVCMPLGWWAMSAGRSLSALVRTRGRDVAHLMEAVVQLRRLFGFARVFIILYALAAATAGAAFVWCNFVVEKGGKCFAFWG